MRIILLIALIITALSTKFVDVYKTEKKIQKEDLYKCILNSNELTEDIKVIYGDIKKAFINHNYLDIIKELVDYNPRNNKLLVQCSNELLDEEDDIVLERGAGKSSSRSSRSSSRFKFRIKLKFKKIKFKLRNKWIKFRIKLKFRFKKIKFKLRIK